MRKILFTKYSNERDPRFAIRTDIWEESGKKGVSKKACYPQGKKHVESIFNIFQKLENTFQNTKIQINQCNLEEEQLILEYLSGNTLQEILDGLLKQRKIEEFKTILQEYISIIEKTAQTKFVITEEFQQVFGKIQESKEFFSAEVTDIDMVLGNVIVQGDKWTLIDFEWTFSFPIPIQYVIYRILHYYEKSNAFRNQIASWNLYETMRIGKKEQEMFQGMEENFQKYILGNYVPLRALYPRITPGVVTLPQLLNSQIPEEKLQIFMSKDGIAREEESFYFPMEQGRVRTELKIENGTVFIRLDPGEALGVVIIKKLEWKSGEKCVIKTNGIQKSENEWLFINQDPQIYIEVVPKDTEKLLIEVYKNYGLESYAQEIIKEKEQILRQKKEILELTYQLKEKEQKIQDMENTKVWKTYKKYKKMVKGD